MLQDLQIPVTATRFTIVSTPEILPSPTMDTASALPTNAIDEGENVPLQISGKEGVSPMYAGVPDGTTPPVQFRGSQRSVPFAPVQNPSEYAYCAYTVLPSAESDSKNSFPSSTDGTEMDSTNSCVNAPPVLTRKAKVPMPPPEGSAATIPPGKHPVSDTTTFVS